MKDKSLQEKIINLHGQIEDELNFIIDVDHLFTNEYYKVLDNVDKRFILLDKTENGIDIDLFETEKEGIIYSKELKHLLFMIKKNSIMLYLKKLKLLFRRKRTKEEVLILLSILKKKEEFFLENKNEFSKQEKEEITKEINEIKNIVKEKTPEDYITPPKKEDESHTFKDISKLFSFSSAYLGSKLLSHEKKENLDDNYIEIIKVIDETTKQIPKEDKLDEEKSDYIEKNEEIKTVSKVGSLLSAPVIATTIAAVANPPVVTTALAIAGINILDESKKEKPKEEKEDSELEEVIETIEETDIDKEQEILKDNELIENDKAEQKEYEEKVTKEDRYKGMKIGFENINKKEDEKFRVRGNYKKNEENKLEKEAPSKTKKGLSSFITRFGALTLMFSVNIMLTIIFANYLSNTLALNKNKTKVLKF